MYTDDLTALANTLAAVSLDVDVSLKAKAQFRMSLWIA
jgi:hypothetical protein